MNFPTTIRRLTGEFDAALWHKIAGKTKPAGALGRLEALAWQIGRIQHSLTPCLRDPRVIVFAGDHGLTAEGISAYPQEVTWQMVMNFLAGGAAVNVLARELGLQVQVVDAGVRHEFADAPGLINAKVGPGTRNSLIEPAMSEGQVLLALARGRALAREAAEAGCNVLAFGEMGIGNSSAAALLLHHLARVPLAAAVGRGTGLDDAGLRHKLVVLERAAARTGPLGDPLRVLAEFGGFEIAMMTGAMIGAAESGMVLLVDGFIAGSALLVAARLAPAVLDYCVAAHQSAESGHQAMLAALGLKPLLALELRLGEGTGAVLAWPLLRAAVGFLNDMASFDSAAVAGPDR